MEPSLTMYFLLFMIYSCSGWILEVSCKLIEYKRFINRGFLIGPYCPIYGFGAVAITLLLFRYSYDPIVLFLMTVVTCVVLEYTTSLVMEKLFKARWWDYSKRKFNIDGRVCLGTTIPFGLFGVFLTYVSNPFFIEILSKVNVDILNVIAIILLVIFIIDYIVSGVVILTFRNATTEVNKEGSQDNTEQITKKVREILSSKSWLHRRLINAYPKLEAIKYRIKEIKDEVKENAIDMKNNINEKATNVRNTINDKKEEVKNSINEKRQEMRSSIAQTGMAMSNGFNYGKRKAKVELHLGRRKIMKSFTGRKRKEN